MNSRIEKLRKQSIETEPSLSIERAQIVTKTYQVFEGTVSTPMLRALCFQNLMAQKTIVILDHELIVGERGIGPQSAPTYPELCCHSSEDYDVIDQREKIFFRVSEETKRIQREEIIPFWNGKSTRDHIIQQMTPQWRNCYISGIFTEFMEQRAPGHTVADDKIYNRGFLDFKRQIEEELSRIDYLNDIRAYDRQEQLKAMAISCDAIITFGQRHADLARKLALKETDSKRKKELENIAVACTQVPALAPRTFREALQMYWFVHLGVITELNTWDAFCPGKLDQHLFPFYQRELAAGTLTRDDAKELLECFWIKANNQPAPPKVGITLKESGTYTDFCNINIGGIRPDGSDGVNEVSYLLLEVIDDMRTLQPSTNVQISKKNPDRFILEAARVIREGMGFPSVFNTDAVVEELLRQGKSLEDARTGGTSGCVEVGCFGKESYILTGYLNLPKILELTLHNGLDPQTGNLIGIQTGNPNEFDSLEAILSAFSKQLHHFVDIKIKGNHLIERIFATRMPATFMSIVIDDCITKGIDYNGGGARYNTRYIQGVGIASITDSLSAIAHHVFDQKKLMLPDLITMLDQNFEGNLVTQQMLWHKTPRYGNDDDRADTIMKQVFDIFHDEVTGRKTVNGGHYVIEMLPTTCHVYFGSVTGALPDGRLAGLPLSEGISPVQGTDRQGPTAVIKSASKMDHLRTGGTLLNQKFTPSVLAGESGLANMKDLIRAYFTLDGHHIQFNIVDQKTLREAQKNPNDYKGLIVRVAGYSDYFSNLDEKLQNEIILRTEHQNF